MFKKAFEVRNRQCTNRSLIHIDEHSLWTVKSQFCELSPLTFLSKQHAHMFFFSEMLVIVWDLQWCMYSRTFYSNWMVKKQRFCGLCYCHQAVNFDQILLFDRIHLPLWRKGEKWSWDAWLSTWGRDRKTSSVSTTYVLGLKLLVYFSVCMY